MMGPHAIVRQNQGTDNGQRDRFCSLITVNRQSVRREVADVEQRPETACGRLGMALYLSFEEEGLRHMSETKYV
jgi:hypothetical protein